MDILPSLEKIRWQWVVEAMQILIAFTLSILLLNSPLIASDQETVALLPAEHFVRNELVNIMVDNTQRANPIEALPLPTQLVPKDVWRKFVIPNLSFNGQLYLRATCVHFQQLVESDLNFKAIVATKLTLVENTLAAAPENSNLVKYVTDLGHNLEGIDRFPLLERTGSIEKSRDRFEILWRLRYLPSINPDVIRRGCVLYGVNTQPKTLEDMASRQTGFHFRHLGLKFWGNVLFSFTPILSGLWATYESSAVPTIRVSEIPWVEFWVPPYSWSEFIHMESIAVYAIDTFPKVCDTFTHCITPEILSHVNNATVVHRTVDSMAEYATGVSYLSYPYLLGVGIPWGLLVAWNVKNTLGHPRSDISALTFSDAKGYYERARGVLHKHTWKNRLWYGAKILASAGLVVAVAINIKNYCDFSTNYVELYNVSYAQAVKALREAYTGPYLAYTSYFGGAFYSSPLYPGQYTNDFCATYFTFDEFKNYTHIFVHNKIMHAPGGWQYVNGTLRYPYLYAYCYRTFEILRNYKILNADTLVNILYANYEGVSVYREQTNPIFTYAGYWISTSLPQLIMTLHLFYLLFVAVW